MLIWSGEFPKIKENALLKYTKTFPVNNKQYNTPLYQSSGEIDTDVNQEDFVGVQISAPCPIDLRNKKSMRQIREILQRIFGLLRNIFIMSNPKSFRLCLVFYLDDNFGSVPSWILHPSINNMYRLTLEKWTGEWTSKTRQETKNTMKGWQGQSLMKTNEEGKQIELK